VLIQASEQFGKMASIRPKATTRLRTTRRAARQENTTKKAGNAMSGPLADIKVIEIGQAAAGPMAGMILGEMRADVIKIEKLDGGDARAWGPPFIDGCSMLFHSMNRNKKSVTLDIKNPDDVAKLKRLVADADILIQNTRSGVVGDLGICPGRDVRGEPAADLLLGLGAAASAVRCAQARRA
jgi:hypothetical protein